MYYEESCGCVSSFVMNVESSIGIVCLYYVLSSYVCEP